MNDVYRSLMFSDPPHNYPDKKIKIILTKWIAFYAISQNSANRIYENCINFNLEIHQSWNCINFNTEIHGTRQIRGIKGVQ